MVDAPSPVCEAPAERAMQLRRGDDQELTSRERAVVAAQLSPGLEAFLAAARRR
jgi:hypothetical protein